MTSTVERLPRVLVIETEAKHRRVLARIMRAVRAEVDASDCVPDALAEAGGYYDLIVANYDTLAEDKRRALLDRFGGADSKTRLLFFSASRSSADFLALFQQTSLTNLVAKNDDVVDPGELIITTKKILARDIFGIEKYFTWGVVPLTMKLRRSSEKAEVVAAAEAYAGGLDVSERFVQVFGLVADELVTNAVYNAPRDKNGKARFAHIARTEEVVLDEGEDIEVKFCFDGQRLGILTADPFGSLDPRLLFAYLVKCLRQGADQVDQKQGGAGLGLYYVFDSLSSMVVNVMPGKRTEFIGIIDVSGSFRDFSTRHKSFNIFTA